MSSASNYDFAVLGAGVAGLATAKSLLKRGSSVSLIDIRDIAAGASGTPLGLINPATGRWGTKVWRAEECLTSVAKDLEDIQATSGDKFYKNTGILRPAQDKKMATRMRENVDKYDWPDGWCQWLEKDEVTTINPNLHCVEGAMWLPKGLTVNVESYLNAKAAYLGNKGVDIKTGSDYEIRKNGNSFELLFEDENLVQASSLIFTSGYETSKSEFWDFIPLHAIKGQVATFSSPEADNFDYSLSALGYIASISNSRFVAGSTYEHKFENLAPDEKALQYLKKRLGGVYPVLFEKAELISQWAGVRASTPNKKPVLGAHPNHKNAYVFTGLGSKGLMYSVYLSELLSDFIFEDISIPKKLSVNRF